MSESRRWWFHAESLSVVRDDVANIEHVTDPKNSWVSLVPEGLTLARIEDLETQLKEANALILASMIRVRCTGPSCYWLEPEDRQVCKCGSERFKENARAYLKKWEGEK